jgi:hypothetical protein
MSDIVPCPYCSGTGERPLKECYSGALGLLRRQPKASTATALAALAGLDLGTMSNHLFTLEQMGLASGAWLGGERVWAANREVE